MAMELDEQKIDDAVLALLMLGLDNGGRAWKSFDWDAMNRLYEQGLIGNPRSQAKSVPVTDEGEARGRRLLRELFGREV